MGEETKDKLIHIGCMLDEKGKKIYLFLRMVTPQNFIWFFKDGSQTSVEATTASGAIVDAAKFWKINHFRTVNCGFRYTLPERDEHGINALFHQMASSYSSMNGIYFDEELGCNCIVQNASIEARKLYNAG